MTNGTRLFDVLLSFTERAHNETADGLAQVTAAWYDAGTKDPQLRSRRFSGCFNHGTPEELKHEKVSHQNWIGCSAFAFPRVARTILRHGIETLLDVDTVNAHYRFTVNRMTMAGVHD